ncbi:MAG: hypothetical protein ACJ0RN_01620 [Candidatus Neomarinimicrobiota bacterium]|tara:strand:+ start:67 stop:501 length:435 start_codon:yes stop_codon:yes gene_type:complete
MPIKKSELEELLLRINSLEQRLEKLDPTSKRNLPSKKEQVEEIQKNLEEWSKKFPSLDVEFELLKMLDWLKANQKRKKDYKAFFRNWLRKSSNSIEKKVENVYRYIYACRDSDDCNKQESEYKDMYIFCKKCGSQKTIIKSIKS